MRARCRGQPAEYGIGEAHIGVIPWLDVGGNRVDAGPSTQTGIDADPAAQVARVAGAKLGNFVASRHFEVYVRAIWLVDELLFYFDATHQFDTTEHRVV